MGILLLMGCGDSPRAAPGLLAEALRPRPGSSASAPRFEASDVLEQFDSAGGFFRVHFTRSGPNAVPRLDKDADGTPDYVASVAKSFDAVLGFYRELGYREPPRDGALAEDHGGDDRFDVYLLDFPTSADGQYLPDESCAAAVGCSGYMLLENDFNGRSYASQEAAIRLVASHEFFHAVQRAYVGDASGILNEGTAVWASQAFDAKTGDLYDQAPAYLKQPERSLSQDTQGTFDAFTYGGSLFFQFLDEREGRDCLRELWEKLAADGGDWLPALDAVLQARGSALAEAFADFVRWNLYTGGRADPEQAYADGAELPEVSERAQDAGFSEDMLRVFPVAARYYRVKAGADQQLGAAALLEPADGLGLLVAREHAGKIDAVQTAERSGKALSASLQLAAGDVLHAAVYNTRSAGNSLRPDLCLGTPEQLSGCRSAHGDTSAPAASNKPQSGGCSALQVPRRAPALPCLLLALPLLRRWRRRQA